VFFASGFKKFPIGVAKYLTWKETDSISKYTCTHHLWTIPLHIFAVGGDLPFSSYGMSIYIVNNTCAPIETIDTVLYQSWARSTKVFERESVTWALEGYHFWFPTNFQR